MILFISDLHLSPRSPGAISLFRQFLSGPARQADELFILGDLFEAWIGDDACTHPDYRPIIEALAEATSAGLCIKLMHGNRDFLLGSAFERATGCQIIQEPYILSTATWQFVLAHGDALCLDDTAYQGFRAQVRQPEWQSEFLKRPWAERLQIAAQLRDHSVHAQASKESPYTDLSPAATDDFLRDHGYATFIHGHTHQPDTHHHLVDGIHVEHWVLADWHEEHGEYLRWDEETLQRIPLTLQPQEH